MKPYSLKKKSFEDSFGRLKFLMIVIFILGIIVVSRLFVLQVLNYKFYKQQAGLTHHLEKILLAKRGLIKDVKGEILAFNIEKYLLYAVPAEIKDLTGTAHKLAPILNLDEESKDFNQLKNKLARPGDFYEILKRNLTPEEAIEIKEMGLPGIAIEKEFFRYYPEGELFAHVIGYLGIKDNIRQGQYGLEEYLEEELAGQSGSLKAEKSVGNILILGTTKKIDEPINGADIILTLDKVIQRQACSVLKDGVLKTQAAAGSIIILDPKTGAVLAWCNWPSFDPNNYHQVRDYKLFSNAVSAWSIEPGSVFKLITMAAALDTNQVTPETTYLDTGKVKIGGYIIRNADEKVYGEKTMTNVLEKSINAGAIFAAQKVGPDLFRAYVKAFGFGSLTGIEQPAESPGNIKNLEEKNPIYLATASFGQGLSVTPIQLVAAVGAIANSGKLMKPHLVKQIIKQNGKIQINQPQVVRQVFKPETAITLSAMMVSVLEKGYGRLARVPGYYIAGKTGTAQIPKTGQGYSQEAIHSFVGFGPVDNPAFVGLVVIDRPKLGRFAESTAAPIFGQIADFLLKYYNIPPNR